VSDMSIDVVTIDSILLEHTAIVHYTKELRAAVADQATFLLQASDHWDKTRLKELKERYLGLSSSLEAVRDGLMAHCAHEEQALSPVLGKLVTDGLTTEHREIIGSLDTARKLLNKTGLLGDLKPQTLMATTYNVERAVETACRMVDTHEANEVGLFAILKKGLQAE
jgi:hypothetical protein